MIVRKNIAELEKMRSSGLLVWNILDTLKKMVVEGVTRAKGVRPRRQAAPAVPGVLRLMVAQRPSPDPRLAPGTAPCSWWGSVRRCAVPNWWR